jgi:hypothetical protein
MGAVLLPRVAVLDLGCKHCQAPPKGRTKTERGAKDRRADEPSSLRCLWETRFAPSAHSASERLGVDESQLEVLGRPTGGAGFAASGAVEDDLLLDSQGGTHRF